MWNRSKASGKYGAKRIEKNGFSFASKGESGCHDMLLWREKAGEIKILQLQPQVYLTEAKVILKPDFKILDLGSNAEEYVEYKGFETPEWRLKRRLWTVYGPAPLQVWKGSGSKLRLHERIVPKKTAVTEGEE